MKNPLTLPRHSLRNKMVLGFLLTMGLALGLAMAAFVGFEISGFRESAHRELRILGDVLGESSSAAMEFQDPEGAARVLSSLHSNRHIVQALLLDRQGKVFASYLRNPGASQGSPPSLPPSRFLIEGGNIWLAAPVHHAGDSFGTLILQADVAELRHRLAWVMAGGAVLVLGIGAIAGLLAMRWGRIIADPILNLTEVARRVPLPGGAQARPTRETDDEVGLLVDAFNGMLDQLQVRQARLEEAQQVAHLGNWAYDPSKRYSEWSDETFRILGMEPAGKVPDYETFRSRVHPDDLSRLNELQDACFGKGGTFECDVRVVRDRGSWGWIHIAGARFEDEPGRPILRGTAMDFTERKNAEAALLQGQKLESLGVLAGGIAHDFNNLLTALQGYLDILHMDLDPDFPGLDHLNKANRVVRRAADLVRQMLAYSGKAKFEVAPLDFNHLVREMGDLLSVSVSKKANLRFDLAEGLPNVRGDGAQLQQVVMNLVINASDALMGQAGEILLRTSLVHMESEDLITSYGGQDLGAGDYLILEVHDTGHGMDPHTLARIFDPFFTTKFAGRGLGLAAMLGIVKGHKGGIKVYSEVGRGTVFKILLPASEDTLHPGLSPAAASYLGSGLVVIVDDEADIRTSLSALFERMGFEVVVASNGQEGVDRVREHLGRVRLVMLDYVMPVMDGAEAFRKIRDLDASLPVILNSGFNVGESVESLMDQGLAGFLQKPFTRAHLGAKLREVLG